ncbi:MAG TPA: hypothetical protein VKY65_18145 [Alphaproteobacteria bacterium]|nr:hypothetical protein [Alphaproteobacteria bacterium]
MARGGRLFDLVVMVDWSAASRPGPPKETADQIWIAWGTRRGRPAPVYCRTRREAENRLHDLLRRCAGNALVGFDFPNAYPQGSGLGGGRLLARRLSALIEDGADNRNNRFAVAAELNFALGAPPGPFWMCPKGAAGPALTVKRPPFAHRAYGEHRLVERHLWARRKYPHTVWKLGGAGSVGSQTLLGLPVLYRLLTAPDLAERSWLWPFETNWDESLDGVIHAEIWPSLFPFAEQPHAIKDARQVMAVRDLLLDADGNRLRTWFGAPACLSATERRICRDEEGWILGVH